MEQKSTMVVATKYILEVPQSLKEGTYKKEGQKKEIRTNIVPRSFVEDRNAHNNNELYIIDEEATAEMVIQRDKNIILNAAKDKKEKASMSDLIDAIAEKKEPKKEKSVKKVEKVEAVKEIKEVVAKNGTPDSTWSREELQAHCDKNDIKYHHMAGEGKLLELINQ